MGRLNEPARRQFVQSPRENPQPYVMSDVAYLQ